jgi:hypothetical protein
VVAEPSLDPLGSLALAAEDRFGVDSPVLGAASLSQARLCRSTSPSSHWGPGNFPTGRATTTPHCDCSIRQGGCVAALSPAREVEASPWRAAQDAGGLTGGLTGTQWGGPIGLPAGGPLPCDRTGVCGGPTGRLTGPLTDGHCRGDAAAWSIVPAIASPPIVELSAAAVSTPAAIDRLVRMAPTSQPCLRLCP